MDQEKMQDVREKEGDGSEESWDVVSTDDERRALGSPVS
jgi:hypothetical protein